MLYAHISTNDLEREMRVNEYLIDVALILDVGIRVHQITVSGIDGDYVPAVVDLGDIDAYDTSSIIHDIISAFNAGCESGIAGTCLCANWSRVA